MDANRYYNGRFVLLKSLTATSANVYRRVPVQTFIGIAALIYFGTFGSAAIVYSDFGPGDSYNLGQGTIVGSFDDPFIPQQFQIAVRPSHQRRTILSHK
jgi:hypothetical protein